MNLREFLSNSQEAIKDIQDKNKSINPKHKVLGLCWDNKADNILFPAINLIELVVTSKQPILSFIASIFDPIGLFCPVTLSLKFFFLIYGIKTFFHAFSNASGYRFACCVYLRTIYSNNSSESHLIFAKSKVYPKHLKQSLSIH